ncbi:MAG: RNA polymerase sigma-70 factor [Saprospiraceae bacterium]|nr:RNA polymerase sigma-70 factor [Saprospiraceae bacterium]
MPQQDKFNNITEKEKAPHELTPLSKVEDTTDSAQVLALDDEYFIRRAFERAPTEGCELLFKHYHRGLCNHAVRFVYSKQIAEDLVSDVFCRFWKNKSYETVKSSYRHYLYRSVRNEAMSYLRAEFKDMESIENAANTEGVASYEPDYITQFEEISKRLKELVEALPPQCRKAFLMSRFEGKKYQVIATELSLSVKTVEAHISLALQRIKKGLQGYV